MFELKERHIIRLSWVIFSIFLLVLLINLSLIISKGITTRSLPFTLREGRIEKLRNDNCKDIFNDKIVTHIDTLQVFNTINEGEREFESSALRINLDKGAENLDLIQNLLYPQIIKGRSTIQVTLRDTLSDEVSHHQVETSSIIDLIKLIEILVYVFLMFFALSNSYILIKYSKSKENLLIVMFLLLLFTPSASVLLNTSMIDIWKMLISPFWGIFFYHFIIVKTGISKKIGKVYIITAIFLLIQFILNKIGWGIALQNVWSCFWLIKGFLLLRKQYIKTRQIGLKRLLSAFSGIGISLASVVLFFIMLFLFLILLGLGSWAGLTKMFADDLNLAGTLIGIAFLIPIVGFFLGIFWFFGSFSWSLLTGTAMDVKIRSTLIYSLVGFVFIMMFGLIDYTLGEILQTTFGKFFGSEFIAGIPATIGLLLFFNPVRNYAEKVVDKKLNTSDLDFLEKTETFSRDISEEGIIEGFEEYICDNLMTKLSIKKVAIISFDKDLNSYKFNEIRGADVAENSIVKDEKNLLTGKDLIRNSNPLKNIQDAGSFELIFKILFENKHKWFLAFGQKTDNSFYTNKDIAALHKLVEKMRLSLKFILTYEIITKEKFEKIISQKENLLIKKDKKINELKRLLSQGNMKTT
jgi:hypothetical protein